MVSMRIRFINKSYSGYRGAANIFSGAPISATQRATYLTSRNVKQTAATLTMTDIMLQKYISGWAWNWVETWVDLRRFHYTDIDPLTGQQVFKGFTLPTLAAINQGNPVYRVRPGTILNMYGTWMNCANSVAIKQITIPMKCGSVNLNQERKTVYNEKIDYTHHCHHYRSRSDVM